jgi:hypothetical protein
MGHLPTLSEWISQCPSFDKCWREVHEKEEKGLREEVR